MNKIKVSLMAVSVVVLGTLAASAATTTYRAYNLNLNWNNNLSAKIWSVNGGPENPTDAVYPHFDYRGGSVDTDSSGKISGVGRWRVTYSASSTPYTTFYGTISGKLAGKVGSAATVTMTIKADGYTVDGIGFSTPFKGSFKFTGRAGVNPGNVNEQVMVGTITGSFSGSTPTGTKSFKLPSGRVAYISDSGFGYAGFSSDVLQSSKGHMQFLSTGMQGNGSIKNDTTYKASVKGVGSNKGISISFSGGMGFYTNNVGPDAVPFLAPKTAEILKGSKWNGQAIQGAALPADASLIH